MDAEDDYEALRQANIKKNMEILLSLGLQPVSKKTAPSLSAAAAAAAAKRATQSSPARPKPSPSPAKKRRSPRSSALKLEPVVVISVRPWGKKMPNQRRGATMSRSSTLDSFKTSSASSDEDDDDADFKASSYTLRRSGRKRKAPSRLRDDAKWDGSLDSGNVSDSSLTSLTSVDEEPTATFYPKLSATERQTLLLQRRELERLDAKARLSQSSKLPTRIGKRVHDPKTFGPIPGIEVGHWWASRMEVSTDAVHAPPVSGISGNREVGCWSIALSGGYEDDLELGEDQFTYTGCGGRKLSGYEAGRSLNLRTAPQSSDQSFDNNLNAALVKSCETGLPIRVIKGFKDVKSDFSPPTGYVYQGLFYVEKHWMQTGLSGFKVCKFAFRRCPGQPPMRSFREEKERISRSQEEEERGRREALGKKE